MAGKCGIVGFHSNVFTPLRLTQTIICASLRGTLSSRTKARVSVRGIGKRSRIFTGSLRVVVPARLDLFLHDQLTRVDPAHVELVIVQASFKTRADEVGRYAGDPDPLAPVVCDPLTHEPLLREQLGQIP